ncbi:MAG: hypothetical protein AVDCRST_MAG56-2383 [uncultured Cytophagales bacterium]|uniref:DUF4440 domain-containing protein n=1 Tax=uncultured Cytophagales bacterium TaxID=158755 RepID=A0A6J4H121_9SPHI|nr:MAG: hypothetical protein AVDCRST_MAG56-2383 [uncultured Cytophagales bacterium]
MKFTPDHLLKTLAVVFCWLYSPAHAQTAKALEENKQLTATILHLDSLFWQTYNECNIEANARYLKEDVSFYHDKGGVTKGVEALNNALKNNICGNPHQKVRREAVAGSVNVHPMRDGDKMYGAILSGEHYFYISYDGKPEKREGVASFTHLWLLENNAWRMANVLSYNHREAPFATTRKEMVLPANALKQYEGTYTNKQFGSFTVKSNGSYLEMEGGGAKMSLFAERPDFFFSKERDLQFEFSTDPRRKVSKIIVHEKGNAVDELAKE